MTTAATSSRVPVGSRARVRVPATSANLGPGFDCMGLALDWYDEIQATVVEGEHSFELTGEGADVVPRDGSHLVVRTLQHGLADLGMAPVHLALAAHNTIPHSRGLGSSAAAIVGGLALAWGLAQPGQPLDRDWACRLSSDLEGHPDNACAAVLGGLVLAWPDDPWRVAQLEPAHGLEAVVWVPSVEVPTSGARSVLPDRVPRLDAVAQVAHAAVLVHALTNDPAQLLFGTTDHLHQDYRAPLMPASADLVARLRAAGVPAVVSGAGPTVLALGRSTQLEAAGSVDATGFASRRLQLGGGVQLLSV